jgi:hypothetical protein
MKRKLFYRSAMARELLEIFLLSAIGSLLAVRFYLHVSHYPQVGAGGFHIAHMLWGGLLMAAGSVVSLAFIGMRSQRLAAFLSGFGFGIFIDEIGKLITSDNNYFFRPAVGIIYAIFVVLYLALNFLSRQQQFSSREYQLNALVNLEEAIVHDMDPAEKARARSLLAKADQKSQITQQLKVLVENVDVVPEEQPRNITRLLLWLDNTYTHFWQQRASHPLIQTFFLIETLAFVVIVGWGIFNNLDDITKVLQTGTASYDFWLLAGQVISSIVAAGFAIVGVLLLPRNRIRAFEQFRRATLINLFLTEFFIFSRVEFQALPGFIFHVGVLLFITYVMHQERRALAHASHAA